LGVRHRDGRDGRRTRGSKNPGRREDGVDFVDNGHMKSRVFVSCGQRDEGERRAARDVSELLRARGFDVYLAIDVQTILEINTGIIRELKNSDCYLCVNFRREAIDVSKFRGSLFSNQELAIAYALGFERLLVVNQEGVAAEGVLRYIGVNTESFRDYGDCCDVVERALDRAGWKPDYSRSLRAGHLRFSDDEIRYGPLVGRFLYLDVHNDRPDIAALEATGRLSKYAKDGDAFQASPIRSPLKATGRPGFSHTIFPKSHEAFDLLCTGAYNEPATINVTVPFGASGTSGPARPSGRCRVYLNSALDVVPLPCLPMSVGTWKLWYEFLAIDFPVLQVLIELTIRADWSFSARIIAQETA
jgi:hypothetical protein